MDDSVPRNLLFWKWSDADLDLDSGLLSEQIDDLCRRSAFELVAVGLEHTTSSFDSDRAHAAIAHAASRLADHGRRLVLSIDPRQEPDWAARNPAHCLAWVDSLDADLGDGGDWTWVSEMAMVNDHFGLHPAVRSSLLACFAYAADDPSRSPVRLDDAVSFIGDEHAGRVELRLPHRPGWKALVLVAHWLDYPDVFSDAVFERHLELLDRYVDVPLAGAALDEWGTVPQPGFRFERAWANPWWSDGLAASYLVATGRDLLVDLFRQQVGGGSEGEQTAAIVDYFTVLRDCTVAFEQLHYDATKARFGPVAYVGFHPTWWAVDERRQSAELFKNGFNWWAVRRDVGQTDEVAPLGVRLALARKAGRPQFFNMWYSMGTHDLATYVQDAWRNARFGGRCMHLGYRCTAERWAVLELADDGLLEQVSAMEERITAMSSHVGSLVASSVLVVVGWAAAVDWRRHVGADGRWVLERDTLSRGYAVLRALWDAGFVAEFVPDYEDVSVEEDGSGRVVWCGRAYSAAVFVDAPVPAGADRAFAVSGGEPDMVTDVVSAVLELGASPNDVPWGCRLEDGTVLIAAPGERLAPIVDVDYSNGIPPSVSQAPTKLLPTGNPIDLVFSVDGPDVQVKAVDWVVVAPGLASITSAELLGVVIDGEDVTSQYTGSS